MERNGILRIRLKGRNLSNVIGGNESKIYFMICKRSIRFKLSEQKHAVKTGSDVIVEQLLSILIKRLKVYNNKRLTLYDGLLER